MDFFRSFGRNWFEYGLENQTLELGQASLSGYERNELFRNDGDHFTRIGFVVGAGSSRDGRGCVPADFDRDGDVDLFVVNNNQRVLYLENTFGARAHWTVVQLRGVRSNSHGIGGRVRLTTANGSQVREIHLGSGYLSSPPPEAHFGVGDATRIERIEVRWPSGRVQMVEDLEVNRIVLIEEGGGFQYVTPGQKALHANM